MTIFDFTTHLATLYPSAIYTITPLSGGLVNFTVRAHRTDTFSLTDVTPNTSTTNTPSRSSPPSPLSPSSPPPQTLILKHAPPYIATLGPRAPFPAARQTIETAVLRLFSDPSLAHLTSSAFSPDSSSSNTTGTTIRIPRVLSHDPSTNILALEDLGEGLVTLWEFFTPSTFHHHVVASGKVEAVIQRCGEVGKRLGAFFAGVHSPETLGVINTAGTDVEKSGLGQKLTGEVVREAAVVPVLERLRKKGRVDGDVAGRLFARVEGDFERGPYEGEGCLSMGDFHPGSVLVSGHDDDGELVVGVIDWEFATVDGGRGVNGDMAQFLAAMHVLLLSLPREGERGLVREGVEVFVREMCRAYSMRSSLTRRVAALVKDPGTAKDDPAMGIFRSALILFGRETINQAVERTWDDSDMSVEDMIKAGAWYLERAGASVEQMVEGQNWEMLMAEKSKFMLQLFGLASQHLLPAQ